MLRALRRPPGWLLWLLAAPLVIALALRVDLTSDLRAMLPRSDPGFAREIDFFARQGNAHLMAVEGYAAPGAAADLVAVRRHLDAAAAAVAGQGVAPLAGIDAAAAARAAGVVLDRLPALIPAEDLAEVEARLAPAALDARLSALRERLARPDDALTAAAARQDPLGLALPVLGALAGGPRGSTRDGHVFVHPDGAHLLLALSVPFDPGDMARTRRLLATLDGAAAAAAADGVILAPVGHYRHFRDNMETVWSDLLGSVPVCLALIMLLLWSLLRSRRLVAVLHLPALAAVAGGLAAIGACDLLLPGGMALPLPLLGFSAGILGIGVDYGVHAAWARRGGEDLPAVHRALAISYLTTAVAFILLVPSGIPALAGIGVIVAGGLLCALATAVTVVPALSPRLPAIDHWAPVSQPILAAAERRPGAAALAALAISLALVPGLLRLRFVEDVKRFDASRPETWAALEGFIGRWDGLNGSNFLVAEAPTADAGLARIEAARAAAAAEGIRLAPGVLGRLLPSRAEQARRIAAWNAFWTRHGERFRADFAAACARHGLRASAFALDRYAPVADQPAIELATWRDTPVAAALAAQVSALPDGRWEIALPLSWDDNLAAKRRWRPGDDGPVWLANRAHIGERLVEVVKAELLRIAGWIGLAMALIVAVLVRHAGLVLAILLPPAAAMLWTFGLLGLIGAELTPLTVLAAAFVGGIGIDAAVFLAMTRRSAAWSPVLAATATTIVGTGAMALATHPMIRSVGLTITLGMTCSLIACLLLVPWLAGRAQRTPA